MRFAEKQHFFHRFKALFNNQSLKYWICGLSRANVHCHTFTSHIASVFLYNRKYSLRNYLKWAIYNFVNVWFSCIIRHTTYIVMTAITKSFANCLHLQILIFYYQPTIIFKMSSTLNTQRKFCKSSKSFQTETWILCIQVSVWKLAELYLTDLYKKPHCLHNKSLKPTVPEL